MTAPTDKDIELMTHGRRLQAIARVLKKRFNNLSAEEAIKLAVDILLEVERA